MVQHGLVIQSTNSMIGKLMFHVSLIVCHLMHSYLIYWKYDLDFHQNRAFVCPIQYIFLLFWEYEIFGPPHTESLVKNCTNSWQAKNKQTLH